MVLLNNVAQSLLEVEFLLQQMKGSAHVVGRGQCEWGCLSVEQVRVVDKKLVLCLCADRDGMFWEGE